MDAVEKVELETEGMKYEYRGMSFCAPMVTRISGPLHKRVSALIRQANVRERQAMHKHPQLVEIEMITNGADRVKFLREHMSTIMEATAEVEEIKADEDYRLLYGIAQAATDRSNLTAEQCKMLDSDIDEPDGFWAGLDVPALRVAVQPFRDRMGM